MQTVNPQRRALIEAIAHSPGADGPRLDAARWFEAQGDPASVARAEFIRVQLERARKPAHDPAQHALAARELRLLRQWSRAWAEAHPALRRCAYRRGFAEFVHISARTFLPWRKQLMALEPVSDVRLTGLYRPRADIIAAIARCEEWKRVETLRFHHQGPHHEPRELLLELLESPWLQKLTSLHGTRFQLSADGRRRFERLPLLERLHALVMPTLDFFPDDPGAWFSDGDVSAERWSALRDFTVPYDYRGDDVTRWWKQPWWPALTAVSLSVSNEITAQLEGVLPRGLQRFSLYNNRNTFGSGPSANAYPALVQALLERPLRGLALVDNGGSDVSRELCHALAAPSDWTLGALTVSLLDADMIERIASSASARHLRTIAGDMSEDSALEAFATDSGPALESVRLGARVRDAEALCRALRGAMLSSVVRLSLTCDALTLELARALCALPNLAALTLDVDRCDAGARSMLESHMQQSGWLTLRANGEWPEDEEEQRALLRTMREEGAAETVVPLPDYAL